MTKEEKDRIIKLAMDAIEPAIRMSVLIAEMQGVVAADVDNTGCEAVAYWRDKYARCKSLMAKMTDWPAKPFTDGSDLYDRRCKSWLTHSQLQEWCELAGIELPGNKLREGENE